MKFRLLILGLIVTVFAGSELTCLSETPPSWQNKMTSLRETLRNILSDISNDQKYNDESVQKRVAKNAKKLSELAHSIKSMSTENIPDHDPSLTILSRLFSRQADHAYNEIKRGHPLYARTVLYTLTGYCIACHTRNSTGPRFQNFSNEPWVATLSPIEKAEFFAATREFDRALDEYDSIIRDPVAHAEKQLEWEKAIRHALAIAIRVNKNPNRAMQIVDRVLDTKQAPYSLREQAAQWKASLKLWKAELPRQVKTEQGYRVEALRLIELARTIQRYPADRSADMIYLRATSVIHDLLSNYPDGKYSDEAYYLAGLCYEALRDLHIWDLHELYYAGCIYKSPHTTLSRACFRHYEESIFADYSGSAGLSLPSDVKQDLTILDGLSRPIEAEGGQANQPK